MEVAGSCQRFGEELAGWKGSTFMGRVNALSIRSRRIRLNLSVVLSQAGFGIRYVVVLYIIYHLSHSTLAVGATLGIPSLVQVLLAPMGGIAADRLHRPHFIATAYGLSALATGLLWWAAGHVPASYEFFYPLIYTLYALTAASDALVGSSYRTLMSEWVSESHLVQWEGLWNALRQGFWLGGILVTGWTITYLGPGVWLFTGICLFVAAALIVLGPYESPAPRGGESRLRIRGIPGEIRNTWDSLRLAWQHLRDERFMWAFAVVISLSNIPHNLLLALPFFLSMTLHKGYGGFGVLESCVILGSVLGNVWIARQIREHQVRKLLVVAFLIQSAICIVLFIGARSSFVAVVILLTAYGATDALFTPAYAHLSLVAPHAIRGQIFGLFNAVALLTTPMITLALGWLLTMTTASHIIAVIAVVFALLAIVISRIRALKYNIIRD